MVFKIVWFCLTLSLPENLNNSIFEKPIISQILAINNSRTIRAKSVNLHTLRKWIEYNFQKTGTEGLFFFTLFEVLMSEGRSVLSESQQGTENKMVQASVKKQKNVLNLLKVIPKWLSYKVRSFLMVFEFFLYCLTLPLPEKLKNPILEMSTNPHILAINNSRTTVKKQKKYFEFVKTDLEVIDFQA